MILFEGVKIILVLRKGGQAAFSGGVTRHVGVYSSSADQVYPPPWIAQDISAFVDSAEGSARRQGSIYTSTLKNIRFYLVA